MVLRRDGEDQLHFGTHTRVLSARMQDVEIDTIEANELRTVNKLFAHVVWHRPIRGW